MRGNAAVFAAIAVALVTVGGASGKSNTDLCTATTNAATGVGQTSATLNGTLAFIGTCGATYRFDYGLTAAYGSTTPATAVGADGAKSAMVAGLTSSTTYHFRIRTASSDTGVDMTFTTLAAAPEQPGPPPESESADVGVVKTATPSMVTVGDLITYTEVVTNAGPAIKAFNVVLSDPLPAGLSLVSVTTTKGSCSGTVQCSLGDLFRGETATVTIVARATRAGRIVNTAGVGATNPDPNVGANQRSQAEVLVQMLPADLALALRAPRQVRRGGTIAYDVTVLNRGPAAATGVVLTLGLSQGSAALVSAPGCAARRLLVCDLGSLAAGAKRTLRAVLRPRRAGLYTNVGRVSGNEPDPLPANNSAAVSTAG